MRARGTKNQAHPVLPAVNLLSPSAFARLATRRLRRRFLLAGVGLVVLVGASGTLQHLQIGETERLVAVEQAETARLGADTQALAPVRAFVSGVAVQEKLVETSMAAEIYSSEVLEALQDATPTGLRLETITLDVAAAQPIDAAGAGSVLTPCPGPDPFNTRTVIGCVTLSGAASDRGQVGEFVIRLGEVDLFVEPFVSTTTTADAADVSFTGSVGLSRTAFSGRYGLPAEPIADEVAR